MLTSAELAKLYRGELDYLDPSKIVYAGVNIAPTQPLAIVRMPEQGKRVIAAARWGLLPGWAKDIKLANKTFNARSETVADKPMFRSAYKRKRCLVPVSGFYEWKTEGKKKTPHLIEMADGSPTVTFAGLWETWTSPDGVVVDSCTILTKESTGPIKDIHDRMPVILKPEAWDAWMSSETPMNDVNAIVAKEWTDALKLTPVEPLGSTRSPKPPS